MSTIRLPKWLSCPKCKTSQDSFTSTENVKQLKDGDLCVCAYCGSINEFKTDNFVSVTKEKLKELRDKQPETYAQSMYYAAYFSSSISPLNLKHKPGEN